MADSFGRKRISQATDTLSRYNAQRDGANGEVSARAAVQSTHMDHVLTAAICYLLNT